jgi:hypothetical protein
VARRHPRVRADAQQRCQRRERHEGEEACERLELRHLELLSSIVERALFAGAARSVHVLHAANRVRFGCEPPS